LILGQFQHGGMEVLQAVSKHLQGSKSKYMPVIFNFDRPHQLDLMETVKILGGLSNFIVADLSGPSVSGELFEILRNFKKPMIPFLKKNEKPFGNYYSLPNQYTAKIIYYTEVPELLESISVEVDFINKKNLEIREGLQQADQQREEAEGRELIP